MKKKISILFLSLLFMSSCSEENVDSKSLSGTIWRSNSFIQNNVAFEYIEVHFISTTTAEITYKENSHEAETDSGWFYTLSENNIKIYEADDPDDDDGEYFTGSFDKEILRLTWAPDTSESLSIQFKKR